MKKLDELINCIEFYKNIFDKNGCFDCHYHKEDCIGNCFLENVLYYLKEHQKILPEYLQMLIENVYNEPLSWDELKNMVGKPVWIEEKSSFLNEWLEQWEVIRSVWDDECDEDAYIVMTDDEFRYKDKYGKKWRAYRKERK